MDIKDTTKDKSVNDDTKKDELKASSSKGVGESKSLKKKGIPNSGTNVFFNENLNKNKDSSSKPKIEKNYWKQGNLFDLGESIKNLKDNPKTDLEKDKKSTNNDSLNNTKLEKEKSSKITKSKKATTKTGTSITKKGTASTQKDSVSIKKDSASTKKDSASTKKDSASIKKDSASIKKDSASIKKDSASTKKDSASSKKGTASSKKGTASIKKDSTSSKKSTAVNQKGSLPTNKISPYKKSSVKNPLNIKKETGNNKTSTKGLKSNISSKEDVKKTEKSVQSQSSTSSKNITSNIKLNAVNPNIKNGHSPKSHFISIILMIISVFLIFVIGFLLNSYLNNERNDYSIGTEDVSKVLLVQSNSQIFEATYKSEVVDAPKIIKPALNEKDAETSYEIVIEKGMSAKIVAQIIAASGYQDEDVLLKYFIDNGIAQKINIGTYYLIPSMSLSDIVDKISVKDVFTMTIYPGMTLAQIDSILSKRNLCDAGDFIDECTSICDEYGLSFVEGWFYPGKYDINRKLNVRELCLNMYYSMHNALSPLLEDIAKSDYSIEQTLIIASLIQAETNDINQMPLISEVIHNRLKSNMPLGINATTCYELGVYKSDIDQSVYDTITDYNTRRKKGLVPSAIGAVSFDALQAAVHPSVGDYLYYNHTKDGEMLMAKTYELHLINIEGNK
jgi:UPF0755 protein